MEEKVMRPEKSTVIISMVVSLIVIAAIILAYVFKQPEATVDNISEENETVVLTEEIVETDEAEEIVEVDE